VKSAPRCTPRAITALLSTALLSTALLTTALLTTGLLAAQTASSLASRAEAAVVTDPTASQALATVARFQGVWTSPPTNLSSGETTDAPLMGNGDVGVAVGGSVDDQTFYIGKNDFFSTASNSIEPLGRVVLALPGMAGASYHVVQDIAKAQVDGTYALDGDTVATTSWVSATKGMLITSITLSGTAPQAASVTLQDGLGDTPASSVNGRVINADVQAGTVPAAGNPQARMSATLLGGTASLSGNQLSITLRPGTTYTLATAIVSSHDTSSYASAAQSMASSLTTMSLAALLSAHESWWRSYWSRSFVQIPDQAVEKSWYGSLYLLGCVSRAGKYAPGLWGNWIIGNMNWNGDYHTNYNYEAAFYPALSTNHIAQMGSYDAPVLDWMKNGEALAEANGDQGVLYPVGITPNGTTDVDGLYNQKSDAANLASDMVMEYEYSHSATYAKEVLPYLEQVGLFWQNYLTWDPSTDTYDIENDAPQENDPYPQINNILSLGLVHLLFQGLIDMSTALRVNFSLIPAWQHIDSHLAPLPATTENGEAVFSEASQGAGWVNDGNDIVIQAVYPGSQVGLDSSPGLIQTARNTIGALTNAWDGANAPATFYAAAAMVGYNPGIIMQNLDDEATNESYNNMAVHHYGGGVENLNVTTSGLDEMLLQSFQKDIKVFPDWPANSDAKFGDLLAYGDFLISSGIKDNAVQYVQAASQAGGSLTFTNPWPGQSIEYYVNGSGKGTLSGMEITLRTHAGETIDLAPVGTALAAIQTEMLK
jgi:alpha-L-fucosidase 2